VIFNPRFLSKRPSDAATIPLPSDETTPPVTKIYFVILKLLWENFEAACR
jgi:hypothetical protein